MLTLQVWNIDSTKAEKATIVKKIQELCPEAEFQAVFYKRKYNNFFFLHTHIHTFLSKQHIKPIMLMKEPKIECKKTTSSQSSLTGTFYYDF